MKKLLLLLALSLAATTSVIAAESTDNSFREQWTCTGYGTLNIGGPGGVITMTVMGHGETQLEAMTNTQQRCFSQGLQMCMVNNCYKR